MRNIFIINDYTLARQSLSYFLESTNRYEVIGSCSLFNDFIDFIDLRKNRPDLLIFCLNDYDEDKISFLRDYLKRHFKTKVLIILSTFDGCITDILLNSNIDGLILYSIDYSEFLYCIDTIFDNRKYISPDILLSNYSFQFSKFFSSNMISSLSNRELSILNYISKGFSNKEISIELSISERTVKNHIYNLFKKINCNDRSQAILFAFNNGLHN